MVDRQGPDVESVLESDIAEIAANLGADARAFAGARLLLTGAAGFLGRYYTGVLAYLNDEVLDEPCEVIALDNFLIGDFNGDSDPPAGTGIRFVQHDVIEPFDPGDGVDYVIHAAGVASPFYYRAYPLETLEVSVTGTKHLLELAREHDARFLFMSSSEIYGDPDPSHVPTPESYRGNVACQGPRACYDESKRLGETLGYVYHEQFGVHTNAVRPFNIYGPGMSESDYRVLPNFAGRIKGGRPLRIYGEGTQTRTYCYVTDAMTGLFKLLLHGVPGEAYNIGNPTPEISVLDLVTTIEKVLERELRYDLIEHPDSYPADEPQRRCPDIRKAALQLRYQPKVDLFTGLGRYLEWADRAYTGAQ